MMVLNIRYIIAGIPSTVANVGKDWKSEKESLSVGKDFENTLRVT